jgi:hypothetical protein
VRETQVVDNWVSTCLSFFPSAFTAATYIFLAPTYTATIITLEPCPLNAEFQHFILRASLDKGAGTKSSWTNLKQIFPWIGPFFTLKKTFFLKVHWVCRKAWGPTWRSNIKDVPLIFETIRLTFDGFFFFDFLSFDKFKFHIFFWNNEV